MSVQSIQPPFTAPYFQTTQVDLLWIEGAEENWIRFGKPESDKIIDRRRRVMDFAPNAIFAFVRWRSNDYGTVHSSIDIVLAVDSEESYSTLPHIQPGGDVLLHITGWPKVQQVLEIIDAVEAIGLDASEVAPDYWRHTHNRLTVGQCPRQYTMVRHKAWLGRRRLGA